MEQQKVTYNYSFEARLHMTKDISKMAFNQVRTRFEAYGLKMRPSWKKIRIYKGREVFAFLVFRGKTLAVCYALDPKQFENSKYKGRDLSEKKSFAKTPFELKATSLRKVKYMNDLIDMMLKDRFELKEGTVYDDKFRLLSLETLLERGLVKKHVRVIGEEVEPIGEEVQEYKPFMFNDDEEDDEVVSADEFPADEEDEEEDTTEDDTLECLEDDDLNDVEAEKQYIAHLKLSNKHSRKNLAIVNLKDLNDFYENGDTVDIESLKLKGLVDYNKVWLKVLGSYGLKKSLRIKADKYSYYAKIIINEMNGEIL